MSEAFSVMAQRTLCMQSMASTLIAQQVEESSAAASATADSAFELANNADKMQAIIAAYRV